MKIVLNDLYDYNLKIYQNNDNFKFSLDSLLLAEFVEIRKKDEKLLDLCSGNAPLPMIIAKKYNIDITGIEIQPKIYELAQKSIEYNKLNNKIKMLNINACDAINYFPGNNFDIITCNPPFFKVQKESVINEKIEKAIARHEIKIKLEDIFKISCKLLKDNGNLYLVHRPDRIEEIINLANKYSLHLKVMEIIFSNINSTNANLILFKFCKNSNYGTKIKAKIINRETKTYQNIFKGEN